MYVSPLAFKAWHDFVSFVDDDGEFFDSFPDIEEDSRTLSALDRLEYASDWLHLWLLSGRAIASTGAQYDNYVAVIALAGTRFSELRLHRSRMTALWPDVAEPEQQSPLSFDEVAEYWPSVPDAVTRGMFDLCRLGQISVQRSALATSFLASPKKSRYRCV